MDLNYLLSRHQIALMRATNASSADARVAHRNMARGYAERIGVLRQLIGAEGTAILST